MRGATRAGAGTMRRWFPAWALSFLLAACGGGGGGGGVGPSSGLPAALAVSAPAAQQALGDAVAFSANASNPDFSYLWDFGDGSTSTEVAPTHVYSRAGVFTVRLTVGNLGRSISGTGSVAMARPKRTSPRRRQPATTARTASKIRFGRGERRNRPRHTVNVVG